MRLAPMVRCWACLLLFVSTAIASEITLNFKAVKLNAGQRESLNRFLTKSYPDVAFEWTSLEAHSYATRANGHVRNPLSVSLVTAPALTSLGPLEICRSEQRYFDHDAGKQTWRANDDLTSHRAWTAKGGDCSAAAPAPIEVDRSLPDADFLVIDRAREALLKRAMPVIGGSDCARVLHCEVTLRRISRVRQDSPSRVLTKLTYSPLKPGPSCLYVMELSFVGPLNNLDPLGASCPKP
ncbi:MAG: hypothetical protein ABI905_14565 [Betaproteobacteria bacterium]